MHTHTLTPSGLYLTREQDREPSWRAERAADPTHTSRSPASSVRPEPPSSPSYWISCVPSGTSGRDDASAADADAAAAAAVAGETQTPWTHVAHLQRWPHGRVQLTEMGAAAEEEVVGVVVVVVVVVVVPGGSSVMEGTAPWREV